MKVENAIYPNEEQIAGFVAPGHDGPVYMINLLRLIQEIDVHRAAGLAGQLNSETVDATGLWLGQDACGGA